MNSKLTQNWGKMSHNSLSVDYLIYLIKFFIYLSIYAYNSEVKKWDIKMIIDTFVLWSSWTQKWSSVKECQGRDRNNISGLSHVNLNPNLYSGSLKFSEPSHVKQRQTSEN